MLMHETEGYGMRIKHMTLCGMCAAVLILCAWISFPVGDVAITLQTFGIFLCLGVLGGKLGSVVILVYLLLGAVGTPVFSGFRGGLGVLLGASGGYLTGFLACGLTYWLITSLFPKRQSIGMLTGLLVCYCIGSLWYYQFYLTAGGAGTFTVILLQNLLFLPVDLFKLFLARYVAKRILQKLSP